ncbi:cadherin-like beta sandwich domain-containing protein [Paenibacillus pectinilyticus]|uniref:cadherin-like beta sandwich domain-containing protein n=1 Tax=Paenibacillus pectinilyticus TaxID=512399 RepID=UPI00114C9400|nr:cadherin-like beta sandwich domain-containing protein [Paenibacillus pectinilyticus]
MLIGACLGLATSAHAATFTVNTTVDSVDSSPGNGICADSNGQCSVRAALMEANALAGADLISIPPNTYTLTLGQLEIRDQVTLTGSSGNPVNTIIQAAASRNVAANRVLEINPALDATGFDVTIQGLTIRNGKSPDTNGFGGGGIGGDVGNKTLQISNSNIENNIASGEGFGGGLYISGSATGKVKMTDVAIRSNAAGESTSPSYSSRGGGVYFEGDMSLDLSNLTVDSNESYGLGGGVAIVSASPSLRTITLNSSTITGNKAYSKAGGVEGRAGGLYLGSPAVITSTSLTNNTAQGDGGGLVLDFFAGSVSLTDVTVTLNTAAAHGGGMFINANKAPILSNTSIISNTLIPSNTVNNIAVNLEGTDMQVTLAPAAGPSGTFSQGKTGAHYTVTVRNSGNVPSNGLVTSQVTLPTGLTATNLTGTGWACTVGTLTCSRSDALAGGTSYPAIDVTVTVAANAPHTVTSSAQVSGGDELDVNNNTSYHTTTVLSQDATLSGLSSANATLNETFASGTTAYTANVLYAVSSITVTPTVNESHATVKVNNLTVSSGQPSSAISLAVGNTNITNVVVTAEDGITTKTYQITVTRAPKSTNASLSDIKIGATSVTGFAPGTLSYTINVPNTTTSVVVTGTKVDPAATVIVTGGSNLAVGTNTVTVKSTAEDGTTVITYTLNIVRAPSSNAGLSDIKVDGTSVAGFASGTFGYTINVPNSKTSVVVTATKADSSANVVVTGGSNLTVGNNTVTVVVTAEDGTTVLTYTVTVVRAASSNATLSDLKVDGATVPGFVSGTLGYTLHVPNSKTSVVVTATQADSTASVVVTGGSNLTVGNNSATVVVTAENGTTVLTYTVTVVRAASSNASLSDLKVDGTTVTGFASGTLGYTVNVPNATTSVVVAGAKADATASVVVTGGSALTVGNNTVTVAVTAQDGTTVVTYTVTIIRAKSSNANLDDLKVDSTSVAGFATSTLNYTVNVPNATTSVVVTGAKADATASVVVTGGSTLTVGNNTVSVAVTAQDGTTVVTYTVTIIRAKSSNANLTDLKVDSTSVAGFATSTLNYTVNVPNATTSVVVTGVKADATASVVVTGGSTLTVGNNTVTVVVTAQDGTTVVTYTVTIIRAKSSNANLTDLKVDGTSVAGFTAGTLGYTVNVPNTTTSVVVTGVKADATASVVVTGGSTLTVGNNTVTVVVTAQDATTVVTYTVTVIKAKSSNANLTDLKVDGTNVAGFTAGTLGYTVNVPNTTTSVVVTGTKADATAYVVVTGGSNLTVGNNTVTVVVTAEDGSTVLTYTVTVVRAASSNATLSDLKVDGTAISGFAPGDLSYTVDVPNTTTSVVVTGIKADTTANVVVTGGSNLTVGNNTVTVVVTAEDGTTVLTYTVTVVRAASSDASLSDLKVDGTSVPGFAANKLSYTVDVPNTTTSIVVTGIKADSTANVVVTGGSNLTVGNNTVTVVVTAEDGSTVLTYTVTVVRAASSNATLSDLKVDGTSVQGFAPATLGYTVDVPNATTSVAVTGTKADSTANVVITGGNNLTVGNNTVTVVVTAEDGLTVLTYTVTINRAKSSNANLSDLKVGGTTVTDFVYSQHNYTVSVPKATTSVVITGIQAHSNATVTVTGGDNLNYGNNTVTVKVTAEDGTTVGIYTVTVERQSLSTNANLSGLKVNGTTVTDFVYDNLNYTVNVPNETTSVLVIGTPEDSTASVNVVGGHSLIVGTNPVIVTVTAENTSEQKTYTVNVVRASSSNSSLSGLLLDGRSVEGFTSGTFHYDVNVTNAVYSVTVTGIVYDPASSLTINNVSILSGDPATIVLQDGVNSVDITVTAQNLEKTQYSLLISRNGNAELTGLTASGVTLSPPFNLGSLTYAGTVPYGVSTTSVTASVYDSNATITINRVALISDVPSSPINLVVGVNTILVVVSPTYGDPQTYTIKVTRQAQEQPNTPSTPSIPSSPQMNIKIGDDGTTIPIELQRQHTPDGKVIDRVVLTPDIIKLTTDGPSGSEQHTWRLYLPQIPEGSDEFNVSIPKNALQILTENDSALRIETDDFQMTLPKEAVAKALKSNEELYVRLVPIRSEAVKQEAEKRVLTAQIVTKAAGNGKVVLHGLPMTIETNLKNEETKLFFSLKDIQVPSNSKERDEFLSSLGVYIEHSDGDKELVKGTIKFDISGKPLGIEITITKFSTFSVIEVQKSPTETATYKKWIEGYPDGTFRPNQPITRSEAASMFAKAVALPEGQNGVVKFNDVSDTHWAADVIHQVQAVGLLNGYPDGSFKPDASITRAEFATIIARINKLTALTNDAGFLDTQGHWAAGYIQAVKAAGLMSGYEDGSFHPDQQLTRAEAVKAINTLLKRPTPNLGKDIWTDVTSQDWFWLDVQSASESFNAKP